MGAPFLNRRIFRIVVVLAVLLLAAAVLMRIEAR